VWPVKYTGPEGVEGIATTDAKGEHRVTGDAPRKWQSFMRQGAPSAEIDVENGFTPEHVVRAARDALARARRVAR